MDLCDATAAGTGRSRHDVRNRSRLVDGHERQVLAEVAGTHDTDAHPAVLDDAFFHVASDCDERGDPGRRAGFEQLLGGAGCDIEHTGRTSSDSAAKTATRPGGPPTKAVACSTPMIACFSDHPGLREALEGSHCCHGESQAGAGCLDVGVG